MPEYIQRSRKKGWKMPENTLYVGRPSEWGNPFVVGEEIPKNLRADDFFWDFFPNVRTRISYYYYNPSILTKGEAAHLYKEVYIPYLSKHKPAEYAKMIEELTGKNLSCWCKESEPCHAKVLLEICN